MAFGSQTAPAGMGHNSAPFEETLLDDFQTALAFRESAGVPLLKRIDDLEASASRATCDTPETAGRCADLAKLMKAAMDAVEEERMKLTRPVRASLEVLKARADKTVAGLIVADGKLRRMMSDFKAKEDKRIAEEARVVREEARRAAADRQAEEDARRAAAEAAGATYVAPEPTPEPERVPEPKKDEVKGEYGAKLSSTTKWDVRVLNWELAFAAVQDNDKVRDAIQKVLNQMAKGGQRKIAGCEVVPVSGIAVR